jgi:transposase InsO family protein
LFAIDACDREVMAWLATSAGISGEMVHDLMVAGVERRFGISKATHPLEWLSDNGSAYIAKDTLDTATALGLKLCFTPTASRRHSSKLSNAIMAGSIAEHDCLRRAPVRDQQGATSCRMVVR